ncbi:MAG: hypothetical protein CSA84_00265 [Actinomycetales bacterium]|nr:MAG: hypothetical protein CSA84_00265 [Actinomycetales bacterium]
MFESLAVLTRSDVIELMDRSHLTRHETEQALTELESHSLAVRSQVDATSWRAMNPLAAKSDRLAHIESEVIDALRMLRLARAEYTSLTSAYLNAARTVSAPHGLEVLTDRDEILQRMEQLLNGTKRRVWSFLTTRPTPRAVRESKPLDDLLLARGVSLRTIIPDAFARDRRLMAGMRERTSDGVEIRLTPDLPGRLVIIDEWVFVALEPSDPDQGALITLSAGLRAAATDLFERRWTTATSLPSDPEVPVTDEVREDRDISPSERLLLELMAQGYKDEKLARTLNLSVRTVRRMIATLSEDLGANSRFQMALLARSRRWL